MGGGGEIETERKRETEGETGDRPPLCLPLSPSVSHERDRGGDGVGLHQGLASGAKGLQVGFVGWHC